MSFEAICGLLFAAFGSGILVLFAWDAMAAVASRQWPQAKGSIVASRLQRCDDVDGAIYWPGVTYRYTVDGKEHTASRTRFGDRLALSWSAPARRIVQKYPAGSSVAVHYDPDDPSEAVLEPGLNGLLLAGAVTGGALVLLGVLTLAWS